MNTRKTNVVWDPKLVRVEYLDEEGNPYYCSFDASERAATETPRRGARSEPCPKLRPPDGSRPAEETMPTIPFSTRRFAVMILTGAVGEEIIIDGRIRIRILAIDGEEARLEVNFPEFVRLDRNGAHGQGDESRRWPASSA